MKDLDDWRRRIDAIDQQLVKLLNERSQCAVEIGHIKKKVDLPAWNPQREAEILRNVVKSNPGPLDDAAIRRLFERIIDEARSLERHVMDADRASAAAATSIPSGGLAEPQVGGAETNQADASVAGKKE
jgi:chorismate mutase